MWHNGYDQLIQIKVIHSVYQALDCDLHLDIDLFQGRAVKLGRLSDLDLDLGLSNEICCVDYSNIFFIFAGGWGGGVLDFRTSKPQKKYFTNI